MPTPCSAGKLPGAALRIAGNFHLVEHGPNPPAQIEAATIERALDLCALLIDHARAAFALMDADQATADARAIFKWIEAGHLPRFRRADLFTVTAGRGLDGLLLSVAEAVQIADLKGHARIPPQGGRERLHLVRETLSSTPASRTR